MSSDNIFEKLESNDKQLVESIKQSIRDQFTKVNEPWLLNGLYDYYLSTNSVRSMDILVNLREPHYQYLFDRLCESIKCPNTEMRVQALTLLGHIARSQPTWLYKLPEHSLLKEMLKLLQLEVELLPLISALLVLIVLLPMIPPSMGKYLKEVFEIFSRLASWNCSPGKFVEEQMIHMQVALYALFLRLYGMYPCNFLAYLRSNYKDKFNPVFVHTIKPMLDTVKMHPSLVTASKDNETTTERWKKMDVHDVIVECERFSLDLTDRCPHDACQYTPGFRSRSGTTNSTIETSSYHLQSLKNLASLQMPPNTESSFFTPSRMFHVHTPPVTETTVPANIHHPHIQGVVNSNFPSQEGTSPPEAAVEATPETTPIRDKSYRPWTISSFRNSQGSMTTTPTHSQPSSPMRKEMSPFNFPDTKSSSAFIRLKRDSFSNQKLHKLLQERSQASETNTSEPPLKAKPPPSSPLRIINPDSTTRQSTYQRMDSPVSKEDEEVLSIVSKGEVGKQPLRPCDSVLPEFEDSIDNDDEQEHGSPCTAGGLHMPNSKSMNNFAKRVRRLRYHSQCNPETERSETSTGSSPGNGISFSNNTTVRRANSCPEMEKTPVCHSKDKKTKPFVETDEETVSEDHAETVSNTSNGVGRHSTGRSKSPKKIVESLSTFTQTENFWPMPYEHLFLGIFPSLETSDPKPSPAPSPAPINISQERYQPSVYDILDKYIESAVYSNDNNNIQHLKDQLQLLHQQLLFERHRRETHAYRNRRLLSDAKSTRLLEECNSALMDRVQLQQKDIDDLKIQLDIFKRERQEEDKKLARTIQYWEEQCKLLQQERDVLKQTNEKLDRELSEAGRKCSALDAERQLAQASLINAAAEVNVAREQALAGEKGRGELERVNRELLLIGELHLKYKERFEQLSSMRQYEEELAQVKEAYKDELKSLHHQLETKTASLEAFRTRIVELEHIIMSKEDTISSQKRLLFGINEEKHKMLEAVESKYLTQLTINRTYEEKMLELWQRLDMETKRNVHSPDTSSCHEVNVTTTAGLSPHSSPLSASLASSEGSNAFHDKEVKNLQAIVDQPECSTKSRLEGPGELSTGGEGLLASSSKND